ARPARWVFVRRGCFFTTGGGEETRVFVVAAGLAADGCCVADGSFAVTGGCFAMGACSVACSAGQTGPKPYLCSTRERQKSAMTGTLRMAAMRIRGHGRRAVATVSCCRRQ